MILVSVYFHRIVSLLTKIQRRRENDLMIKILESSLSSNFIVTFSKFSTMSGTNQRYKLYQLSTQEEKNEKNIFMWKSENSNAKTISCGITFHHSVSLNLKKILRSNRQNFGTLRRQYRCGETFPINRWGRFFAIHGGLHWFLVTQLDDFK